MTAPFDDSEHARITQTTPDYNSIPWNNDFSKIFSVHTIRKVKFLSKNSILTQPQHFQEFFTPNFFDNFSREIKVVNS